MKIVRKKRGTNTAKYLQSCNGIEYLCVNGKPGLNLHASIVVVVVS